VRTVKYQTARVHWHMGQALLPEHFRAQESSLREDLALRLRLQPMPFQGVGRLRWDPYQLEKGILRLEELTLLLPDGTLVDIPGNTAQPDSFDLNKTDQFQARVHLHLPQGSQHEEVVREPSLTQTGDRLERVVRQVLLSTHESEENAWSFPLVEFQKSPDGPWTLASGFLPELLRVSGSPFFEPLLRRITSVTDRLRNALLEEIRMNHLANKSQLAARECLKGYYNFHALLDNVGKDYHPHPFELFRALHALYIEVCMMREVKPEEAVSRYRHGRQGECFQALLEAMERQVNLARTAVTYLPFARKEGLRVCELPPEARQGQRFFLLLQKAGVTSPLDVTGLKLASESRLDVVMRDALPGVPFPRLPTLPFHHPFTAEVEFFELRAGEEWDHVLREGRLAFYHEALKNARAFLYWREE
jgi:type VI secretion system protein ImpJ